MVLGNVLVVNIVWGSSKFASVIGTVDDDVGTSWVTVVGGCVDIEVSSMLSANVLVVTTVWGSSKFASVIGTVNDDV